MSSWEKQTFINNGLIQVQQFFRDVIKEDIA